MAHPSQENSKYIFVNTYLALMDTPKLAQDLEGQLIQLQYGMAFAKVDERLFLFYMPLI